jgi:uncharacterized protein (UPF0548 family)
MWFFRRPADTVIAAFIEGQRPLPLTYESVGATRGDDWPAGYNHDRNRITLGHGEAVFERAVAALRAWRMFPAPWTEIVPPAAPQREGECVALLIRATGVWWMSAARVVYEVDEAGDGVKRRVGFAYGTLPGHVEKGEERFTVAWMADDSVRYELHAFSRPRHWLVRLGKPFARTLQRRFVRQSLEQMRRLANETP